MSLPVERITEFKYSDLEDICHATVDAIRDGIGFNWVVPPSSDVLESYWKGVLVVPERVLFGGRLEGTLAAAVQLVRPAPSRQLAAFSAQIQNHFVAPWARGHGLAKALLQAAEDYARECNFSVLTLSVRETQEAAMRLYEESGFVRWGVLPYYECVNERMIAGHHFYKTLKPIMKIT